jgi:pyruvate/2-oxoglutarate dehydrogenase complex dihydrolipoamide dehydrogenase (E3) component
MKQDYQVIIIGSGFGGQLAAIRAALLMKSSSTV